jgi:hypothetical protein
MCYHALARVIPSPIGFDVRVFECPACERMASRTTASADVRLPGLFLSCRPLALN